MADLNDVLAALSQELQFVAPIAFGRKQHATHTAPPQYTVYPLRERYDRPQGPGGSGNPRALYARLVDLEIHSWGADIASTEALNQAMITAPRRVLKGANFTLGDAQWTDTVHLELGYVLVLPVTVVLVLPEAAIPTAPVETVTDATLPTVVITQTELDASSATPGDGMLDGGEG